MCLRLHGRFLPPVTCAGDEDRAREHLIRGAVEGAVQLELHPRTCIQVVVQVLQDDGGLLACVLNATCAALVDAGVPMTTMFGAVSCALSPTGAVVVDPDAAEEKEAAAVICLAFPYHHDLSVPSPAAAAAAGGSAASSSGAPVRVGTDALLSDTTGVFSREQFLAVFEVCRQGCAEVSELSRRSLARSLQLLLDGSSAAAI